VSLLVNNSGVQLFELLAASCHEQEMNIGFYSHGRHAVELHCQFVEKVLWVEGQGAGGGDLEEGSFHVRWLGSQM